LRWLRNDAVKETEHAGSDIIATMINGNIIIIMIIVVSNTEKKGCFLLAALLHAITSVSAVGVSSQWMYKPTKQNPKPEAS